MFDRLGMIEASIGQSNADIESAAIEAGAQDVEVLEGDEENPEEAAGKTSASFYTDPTDLDSVNKALTALGWAISKSELTYRAKEFAELTADQRKEVSEFLTDIDDNDDVHRIYPGIR
jgi:transcriptional/translational regulatory protein YebC/TACO1